MTDDVYDWEPQEQYFLLMNEQSFDEWFLHKVFDDYTEAHTDALKYPDVHVRIISGRITLDIEPEDVDDE